MADKWEYAFLTIGGHNKQVNAILNGEVVLSKDLSQVKGTNPNSFLFEYFQELGSQGWELVAAEGNRYIFKRRKSS